MLQGCESVRYTVHAMGCALSNSIRSDPDSLADALFDAIAAARVPKGTLDLPVRSHARRLPS